MKKRGISLFLAAVMLLGMIPASFATETAAEKIEPKVIFDYNCDALNDGVATAKSNKAPAYYFADSKTAGVESGTILADSDGSTEGYCTLNFDFDLPYPSLCLEMDMKIESLMTPASSAPWRGFTLELNIPGNRIVYIAVNSLGEPDSDGKNADIYTFKSARSTSGAAKGRITIPTDGKFHKWEIQFNGEDEIRVFIDGEMQVAFTDITVNSTATTGALRIINGMNNLASGKNRFVFDNIKLTSGITMTDMEALIAPNSTANNFTVQTTFDELPESGEASFTIISKDDPTKVYSHTYKPSDLVHSETVTDIPFTGMCTVSVAATGAVKKTFDYYLYKSVANVTPGQTLTSDGSMTVHKFASLHTADLPEDSSWKEKFFKNEDGSFGGGLTVNAIEETESFTVPVKLNGKFAVYVGYMPGTYQFTVNGRNVYVTNKKTTGTSLGERFAIAGDFKNEEITITNTAGSAARLAYVKFVAITDDMYEKYAVQNDDKKLMMDNDGFSILTGEGENTAEVLLKESVIPYAEPIGLAQYNFAMWVTGMLNFPSKTQKALIENRLRELGVPEEKWPEDNWIVVDKKGDVIDWTDSPMRDLDRRYVENIRSINKEGIPHEILADYITKNNYGELYASLRMSAYYTETATGGQYMNGSIFQLYPEWIRGGNVQLSYYYEGYRDYIFGVLMEMASSANVAGITMDFGRYPMIFGTECTDVNERTRIMNEFVKRVHDNMPEGKILNVRVLHPTAVKADPNGLDYKTWVKNGWVDRVIIGEQGHETFVNISEYANFFKDYPEVEYYAAINATLSGHDKTKEEEAIIAAGGTIEGHEFMTFEEYMLRAYDLYMAGADGIFLFNSIGQLYKEDGPNPAYSYMNNKDEIVKWYTFEYPAYAHEESVRFINQWEVPDDFRDPSLAPAESTDEIIDDPGSSADMTPVFVGIGALAVVVLAIVVMLIIKKKKQ